MTERGACSLFPETTSLSASEMANLGLPGPSNALEPWQMVAQDVGGVD